MSKELRIIIISIAVILIAGTAGYSLLEGWNLLDSLYMTIISITTVGYGEVHPLDSRGRIFTIMLILGGMSILAYSVHYFGQHLIEGELRNIFGRRRLEKKISLLKNHYIVCGFGRMGQIVTDELRKRKLKVVVIEKEKEIAEKLRDEGYIFIQGDATEEDVLLKANIRKAKALVATLPEDAENLYLTITARELNKDLYIVARSTDARVEKKMYRAGANKVISPYRLGGLRMANALIRPEAIEFIELAMEGFDVRMEEVKISDKTPFANKRLRDSGIREKYGAIVVAIKRGEGNYVFNPSADEVLHPGDVLIVIGKSSMLEEIIEDVLQSEVENV